MSNSKQVMEWRRRTKKRAVVHLGGKCSKCGYNKCFRALSFHHRNPENKSFGIAQATTRSWKSIQEELDKCDLLCLNCHAEEEERLWQQQH